MSVKGVEELPRDKTMDTHGHDLDCREDQKNWIENSQGNKEMPEKSRDDTNIDNKNINMNINIDPHKYRTKHIIGSIWV